jgi:hypothetical protein
LVAPLGSLSGGLKSIPSRTLHPISGEQHHKDLGAASLRLGLAEQEM